MGVFTITFNVLAIIILLLIWIPGILFYILVKYLESKEEGSGDIKIIEKSDLFKLALVAFIFVFSLNIPEDYHYDFNVLLIISTVVLIHVNTTKLRNKFKERK